MASSQYFVDIFENIVSEVQAVYDTVDGEKPYFMYGHPVEIAKRLKFKGAESATKLKIWPLIVLITDFEESHDDNNNVLYSVAPTVLIIDTTKPSYLSPERYENTFKPVLYPIYNLLIEKIRDSIYIKSDTTLIEHTKTDRLFWGVEEAQGNGSLIFNDFLDAIELNFTELEVYNTYECQ